MPARPRRVHHNDIKNETVRIIRTDSPARRRAPHRPVRHQRLQGGPTHRRPNCSPRSPRPCAATSSSDMVQTQRGLEIIITPLRRCTTSNRCSGSPKRADATGLAAPTSIAPAYWCCATTAPPAANFPCWPAAPAATAVSSAPPVPKRSIGSAADGGPRSCAAERVRRPPQRALPAHRLRREVVVLLRGRTPVVDTTARGRDLLQPVVDRVRQRDLAASSCMRPIPSWKTRRPAHPPLMQANRRLWRSGANCSAPAHLRTKSSAPSAHDPEESARRDSWAHRNAGRTDRRLPGKRHRAGRHIASCPAPSLNGHLVSDAMADAFGVLSSRAGRCSRPGGEVAA